MPTAKAPPDGGIGGSSVISGFNRLGPCPRSLRSGRAGSVGGRRTASARKCSGVPLVSFPAVTLDMRDVFAAFATFAPSAVKRSREERKKAMTIARHGLL